MNPEISKEGATLTVEGTTFDLSDKRGQKISVYREKDGSITIQSKSIHESGYQLAELEVPPRVIEMVDAGEVDGFGMPILEPEEQLLKLEEVEVKMWEV